jgi:hypothetical protein
MSLKWTPIIEHAETVALSYDFRPSLRQVFYRLVATSLIPNNESAYKRLSHLTAIGRREGTFPDLSDGTRRIDQGITFDDENEALRWLVDNVYRHDRMWGQENQLWVVVEKNTLLNLARSVADEWGIPVVALRGYDSQTLNDLVGRRMRLSRRHAIVLYLGDFDPSGEDIERSFMERVTDTWTDVELRRVAVTESQIVDLSLPPNPGKASDPRSAGFVARHGRLVQVEVEAINPRTLSEMLTDALTPLIDQSLVDAIVEEEEAPKAKLRSFITIGDEEE